MNDISKYLIEGAICSRKIVKDSSAMFQLKKNSKVKDYKNKSFIIFNTKRKVIAIKTIDNKRYLICAKPSKIK